MIDSHCHLDYCEDPNECIDPALAAMVTVGTSVERNDAVLAIADRVPNVWAAVGIHPNSASAALDPATREVVERQAAHGRVVAIGETGFDTHWDRETLESQRRAFDWQADLAARRGLPLILHVRDAQGRDDASRAAATALAEAGCERGVLHCFNGNRQLLETALELGWMVSFAGNLTYPSAGALREVAPTIPRDRLMVETDSPFLAPVPHRGKRNRPALVRHTAEKLAEVIGARFEEVESFTDANAVRFYGLPLQAGPTPSPPQP